IAEENVLLHTQIRSLFHSVEKRLDILKADVDRLAADNDAKANEIDRKTKESQLERDDLLIRIGSLEQELAENSTLAQADKYERTQAEKDQNLLLEQLYKVQEELETHIRTN